MHHIPPIRISVLIGSLEQGVQQLTTCHRPITVWSHLIGYFRTCSDKLSSCDWSIAIGHAYLSWCTSCPELPISVKCANAYR